MNNVHTSPKDNFTGMREGRVRSRANVCMLLADSIPFTSYLKVMMTSILMASPTERQHLKRPYLVFACHTISSPVNPSVQSST